MSPRRIRNQRGAAARVSAGLLAAAVVVALVVLCLALVQVFKERRQMQGSAEAAALSLAKSCAQGNCVVDADAAAELVDKNANERDPRTQSQCSLFIDGTSLPPCGISDPKWPDCSPIPASLAAIDGLPYVEVRTRTLAPFGGGPVDSLKGLLARVTGNSRATLTGGCARTAYGVPAGGHGDAPITLSACDWQHATGGAAGGGGGASYYPRPVYNGASPFGYGGADQPGWPTGAAAAPTQNPGGEIILLAQNPVGGATTPTGCPSWDGHPLRGGFGVLATTSDPCQFSDSKHHWMPSSAGNNVSCDLSRLVGKVINLPIFDCTNDTAPAVAPPVNGCTTGGGSKAFYHRAGYAAFYLSGYNLNVSGGTPNQVKSLVTNTLPCDGGDRCIAGWFVTGGLSTSAITGPPSGVGGYGTYSVIPAD